ncbi:hypothetical protein [Microbacterium sp. Clip185]|uniref:hypothetical protein n=1 Tax=Microbacterium sp. Clip185 TaxID=3025663 RepID=UPI0023653E07|nr:hypothetical protein [Microbacterium sp. Clip185]WDG16834.1 hypothetical protein PQV94_09255 [Microbacterium sp. Clip185]
MWDAELVRVFASVCGKRPCRYHGDESVLLLGEDAEQLAERAVGDVDGIDRLDETGILAGDGGNEDTEIGLTPDGRGRGVRTAGDGDKHKNFQDSRMLHARRIKGT